jgi:hypothetical protein
VLRSFVIGLLVLACSGTAVRPVDQRPVEVTAAAPDAAPEPWVPGQPIRCATVDDCVLVSPGHLACPGVCGFCGGSVLAPRGYPAIQCPERPRDVTPAAGMPPPPMPNCAACTEQPKVRAACEANVCVTKPA